MRTRTNGEARERLRQLLYQHARRLGLTNTAVETLGRTASLDRWDAGDRIVAREDGHDLVSFLVIGAVKIVCPGPRNAQVAVCFGAPGQVIATGWLFDDRPVRREFEIIAHDELGTTVASWSQNVLTEVMASLPPSQALQLMSYGWRAFSSLLREKCHLLGLSLRDRVLLTLIALARDFGIAHRDGVLVNLRLTHADVASMAVGSRANVTRAIEELRGEGLVACEPRRLVVTRRGLTALRSSEASQSAAPARPAASGEMRRRPVESMHGDPAGGGGGDRDGGRCPAPTAG
ncbi:MAG TPA: Crp/Fnr family transcriptional regulator [Candidatus Eisenbacteria bacterium]|nr:Crp/Fnr family transcriptional regulator [Candidatus Eisenbacteria bacterium]